MAGLMEWRFFSMNFSAWTNEACHGLGRTAISWRCGRVSSWTSSWTSRGSRRTKSTRRTMRVLMMFSLHSYQLLFSRLVNNLLSFLLSKSGQVVPNCVVDLLEDEREYQWFDVHLIQPRIPYRYHYVHNNDNAKITDSIVRSIWLWLIYVLKYLFPRVLAYQRDLLYYRVHWDIRNSYHYHRCSLHCWNWMRKYVFLFQWWE